MAVEASIVISFGDDSLSNETVIVEFDPEHSNNLDSDGNVKSTFDSNAPDQPVFLLHYSNSLRVEAIVQTDGTVGEIGGPISQQRKKDVIFSRIGDTSNVSYLYTSLVSQPAWIGVLSGVVEVDGSALKLVSGGPCTGEATINVLFQKQYMLTPPGNMVLDEDGNYQITIFIFMEAA